MVWLLSAFQLQIRGLGTYKFTWATFLTESGDLFISHAFGHDDEGPLSTMNMMRYLICNAADEVNNGIEWKLPEDLKKIEETELQKEARQIKMVKKEKAKDAKEVAKQKAKDAKIAAKKNARADFLLCNATDCASTKSDAE